MQIEKQHLAKAFQEWMRRYTEDPQGFKAEFESVQEFREEPQTYGEEQADYFMFLLAETGAPVEHPAQQA